MKDKWEHRVVSREIKQGDRVLEIGCGSGHFIKKLISQKIDATGIELNSNAVEEAKQLGLPVFLEELIDFSKGMSCKFDVVCNFQILEHSDDPKAFIETCIGLLKPSGRLWICVPNSAGFIRLADNDLLNQPPHHVTRWSKSVFRYLETQYPVKIKRILYEPLASYHLEWYINLQLSRLPLPKVLKRYIYIGTRKIGLPIAQHSKIYRILSGHTICVCYEKNEVITY
ncbi:MAG: class I SAM-dependent methyltransferase [Thermodesulfobacteriota bacterium]